MTFYGTKTVVWQKLSYQKL